MAANSTALDATIPNTMPLSNMPSSTALSSSSNTTVNTMPPNITLPGSSPPVAAPPSTTFLNISPPTTVLPSTAPPNASFPNVAVATANLEAMASVTTKDEASMSLAARKSYLFERAGSDTVWCYVGNGNKQRSFLVHKDIICKVPYFHAMFNGNFAEGVSQTAEFPDDDPTTFALLLGFIYTGIVEPVRVYPLHSTPDEICGSKQLMMLHTLAEKYNMTELQDQSMNALTKYCREYKRWPIPTILSDAYGWTYENSRLRMFIVRVFVYITLNPCKERNNSDDFSGDDCVRRALIDNEDLFKDVLPLLRDMSGKKRKDPCDEPACDYHQHLSTEPCPYKKS